MTIISLSLLIPVFLGVLIKSTPNVPHHVNQYTIIITHVIPAFLVVHPLWPSWLLSLDFFLHPQPTCARLRFPLSVTLNFHFNLAIIALRYYWTIALHHSWPLPSPILPYSLNFHFNLAIIALRYYWTIALHHSWPLPSPILPYSLFSQPDSPLTLCYSLPPLSYLLSISLVCTFPTTKHSHGKSTLHVKHLSPTYLFPPQIYPDSLAPFPSSSEPFFFPWCFVWNPIRNTTVYLVPSYDTHMHIHTVWIPGNSNQFTISNSINKIYNGLFEPMTRARWNRST